jgi:hypothetical protein
VLNRQATFRRILCHAQVAHVAGRLVERFVPTRIPDPVVGLHAQRAVHCARANKRSLVSLQRNQLVFIRQPGTQDCRRTIGDDADNVHSMTAGSRALDFTDVVQQTQVLLREQVSGITRCAGSDDHFPNRRSPVPAIHPADPVVPGPLRHNPSSVDGARHLVATTDGRAGCKCADSGLRRRSEYRFS